MTSLTRRHTSSSQNCSFCGGQTWFVGPQLDSISNIAWYPLHSYSHPPYLFLSWLPPLGNSLKSNIDNFCSSLYFSTTANTFIFVTKHVSASSALHIEFLEASNEFFFCGHLLLGFLSLLLQESLCEHHQVSPIAFMHSLVLSAHITRCGNRVMSSQIRNGLVGLMS